jgi:hypothetical protein
MKRISEETLREEASRGKNEPIAKSAKVNLKQNAEVEPSRAAIRKQKGTDEAQSTRR